MGYTGQSDSLWDQPELAATVIGPSWVEIDSLAGEIELVLPGFGSTYDAAVLVLSAGVGPFGTLANKTGLANLGLGHHEATRYRLNLALRDTSTADFNPRALVESGLTKDHPSWSPDGTELVYTAATMPSSQIYRKPVAGGLSTLLNPGEGNQQTPDWSPRGDLVVYAEDNTDTTTVLFTFNVDTEALEPVTSGTAVDLYPSFSPNGRRIAYAHRAPGTSVWSVRRVNVNGTNDTAFVSTSHSYPISSIRWSPDGITVYYVSNAKLYGVPASGGSAAERSNVAPSLGSFDLPAGAGRLMLEELGLTRYNCNPAGFTQNFNRFVGYRRLALRDTTVSPRDSEMRFYRAGASFYSPRYSPDNRFVAYRSDQNAVGGGDLFVGQVIWDRAPVFTHAINDTSVWEGQGVTINLSATDPDGDAVSYAGAHLPSGATITNGYFLWLNPTLTGAPHYVTLRALSPGGAVTSKVFKIDIVPRPVAVSNLVAAAGRYDAAIAWSEPYQPGGEAGSYEIRYRTGSTITEVNFSSGALVPYSVAPGPQFTEHCTQPDVNSCTTYYFAMRTIRNGVPSFISNVASASTKCSGTSLVECESNGLYGGGGGGGSQRTGGLELSSAGGLAAASSSGAPTENSLLGGARGALGSDLMRLPGDAGPVEGAYRVRLRQSASNEVELDRITLASVDYDPGLEVFAGSDEVFLGSTTPVAAVRDAEVVFSMVRIELNKSSF